jgi:hypothetical protein
MGIYQGNMFTHQIVVIYKLVKMFKISNNIHAPFIKNLGLDLGGLFFVGKWEWYVCMMLQLTYKSIMGKGLGLVGFRT